VAAHLHTWVGVWAAAQLACFDVVCTEERSRGAACVHSFYRAPHSTLLVVSFVSSSYPVLLLLLLLRPGAAGGGGGAAGPPHERRVRLPGGDVCTTRARVYATRACVAVYGTRACVRVARRYPTARGLSTPPPKAPSPLNPPRPTPLPTSTSIPNCRFRSYVYHLAVCVCHLCDVAS
jgi:hypothetical protein